MFSVGQPTTYTKCVLSFSEQRDKFSIGMKILGLKKKKEKFLSSKPRIKYQHTQEHAPTLIPKSNNFNF